VDVDQGHLNANCADSTKAVIPAPARIQGCSIQLAKGLMCFGLLKAETAPLTNALGRPLDPRLRGDDSF
jgi:hypothetical protein